MTADSAGCALQVIDRPLGIEMTGKYEIDIIGRGEEMLNTDGDIDRVVGVIGGVAYEAKKVP